MSTARRRISVLIKLGMLPSLGGGAEYENKFLGCETYA